MAQLPPIKRFTQEDYSNTSTIPAFTAKFFYPLNLFLNAVYLALNNGLTFASNLIATVTTQTTITSSASGTATTTMQWPYLQSPPVGVLVLACSVSSVSATLPLLSWSYASGTITINLLFTAVSGSNIVHDSAKTYSLTFLATAG